MAYGKMISKKKLGSVVFASMASLMLLGGSIGQAQIVGSPHDMTSTNSQVPSTPTDEVCVFCHTPHGADTTAAVPLWNRDLTAAPTYTRYSNLGLVSFDSAEAPVGSVSLACLSCHDGTQAMDSVINAPGSGLNSGVIGGGAGTLMTGSPVPMLGTDLQDDHPISMQYGGGGVNITTHTLTGTPSQSTATLGDPDFVQPFGVLINTNSVWWVDSPVGAAGTREKTDMVLYSRDEATVAGGLQPFVECGSCHDPHNSSTAGATSVAFLRVDNTASQICTSCHLK